MSVIDPDFGHRLAVALATGPQQVIAEMNAVFLALRGVRTVTWLAVAPDKSVTHRIGTSNPAQFPIGGFDPIDDSAWNRRIFGDKQPVVGNDPAGMAAFIPETDQLVAMGFGATLCAPIVIGDEVVGTVNLLGDAGILTPDLLSELEALLPIAAVIFAFKGINAR